MYITHGSVVSPTLHDRKTHVMGLDKTLAVNPCSYVMFNIYLPRQLFKKVYKLCVYFQRSKDKKVIDFHYFVRICVPELNKKATPELFEMQFKEGLHQLELAFYDRRVCVTLCYMAES